MPAQGLTTSERVRRRPEFERAYEQGARVSGRFMTVFVLPNGTAGARLGVAATRKLGSAVTRNRAKRLAREIFRRNKVTAGLDVVIVPRLEMLDASFASLETDFVHTIERGQRSPAKRRAVLARARRPGPAKVV